MSGHGDETIRQAVRRRLEDGPADVIDLLLDLRDRHARILGRGEGVLHAFLHREVRRGRLAARGRSARGLAAYALPGPGPEGGEGVSGGAVPPVPPAEAVQFAAVLREAGDRDRVAADVAAHLADLRAAGAARAFGRGRAARHLLRRVDRGRRAVVFSAGLGDEGLRFVLHEGPWILSAIVVFLVVRTWVAEVFVIPSGSMLPTLQVGDRVAVWKFRGRKRPERWRIVTFERNGITYVKRAVGLGGETFSLEGGDVYVGGALVRKPDDVREALRFPYRTFDLAGGLGGEWEVTDTPEAVEVSFAGGALPSSGDVERRHAAGDVPLRDVYLTFSVERAAGEEAAVRIAYVAHAADPTPGRAFELVVSDGGVRLLDLAGDGASAVLAEEREGPSPGALSILLWHVDGALGAEVAGHRLRLPLPTARTVPAGHLARPGLRWGRRSQPLSLVLEKDVHYSRAGGYGRRIDGEPPLLLPEDAVFCLGDNTYASSDSRMVGPVRVAELVGPVAFRIWPPGRIGPVR